MKLDCATCSKTLDASKFSPRSDTPRGYRSNCKACERELCREAWKKRHAAKKRKAKRARVPKASPILREAARIALNDPTTAFLAKLAKARGQ